jgi:AraC-like DNA-binding protein
MSQYFIHFFEDVSNGISLFHNHRSVFKLKAGEMDITLFKRLLDINPGRKINRSDNPKIYEKSKYYAEYEDLNKIQDQGLFLETQGIILQLISRFMDRDGRGGSGAGIPSKVVELLDHIQLNLGHSLRVRELADMVNLHPDYLSRQLLQLTGERLLAYIHTKRIERAQYLIVTTDMSFSQIAEATGFDSLPHFSKVFKKKTSLTPGQYRAQQFG